MDSTSESLGVDNDPVRRELPLSRDVASEFPPAVLARQAEVEGSRHGHGVAGSARNDS